MEKLANKDVYQSQTAIMFYKCMDRQNEKRYTQKKQVSIILTLSGFIISWENKNFKGSKIVKVPTKFHANHNKIKVSLFIHLSTVTVTLTEQLIKIVEKS